MTQRLWPEAYATLTSTQRTDLRQRLLPHLNEWMNEKGLPETYRDDIENLFLDLAAHLASETEQKGCLILGLTGGQGAGKSTLAELLVKILQHGFDKKAVTFSLDDIYLSHDERQQLARDVHPLLATRGVPGTHDPLLGLYLLQQLKIAGAGDLVHLPRFDKAIDDRLPPEQWRVVEGPFDLIIFEGWCVGAMPQTDEELIEPVNTLEENEDEEGLWRRFVNDELSGPYIDLFVAIDILMMLKVPGMEQVTEWRSRQEEELCRQRADDNSAGKIMSRAEIIRFIQHYERISRNMLAEMPERADIVITFDEDQRPTGLRRNLQNDSD